VNKAEQKETLAQRIRQDRMILIIALASGLVAVILLYYYITSKERALGDTVPVLVALKEIQKGETFTQNNLEVKEIPQHYVVPNAIGPEYLTSILDSKSIVTIGRGQQISWSFPEIAEVSENLSQSLEKDKRDRAVTMAVDEISGVAGHISVNDRVDVIGTFQIPGTTEKAQTLTTKTKTILQCVTVLAVGEKQKIARRRSEEAYTSVTLKVTPEEAELLAFAENSGTLRLLLRHPDDLEVSPDIPQIGFDNLFEVEKKQTNIRKVRVHQSGSRNRF